MIRLCSCKVSSTTIIENQTASASCRSCGGKLVNGLQALSGNMLSTMGLELSGVVDPHLNWSTASKGRQRARRARTSLTSGNKRKFMQKSSTGNVDVLDKGIEGAEDLIVSDSEKVGVSILGRRFSDSLQSVPIKKRRFLLMRSPSPPPASSYSDDSDYFLESHSNYDNKRQEEETLSCKRSNTKTLKDEACDAADFSGISILAAAACDSDIVGDIINVGGTSKGNYSNEMLSGNVQSLESCSISKDKEQQLQKSDDLRDKCHVPSQMSSTSILSADEVKFDGSKVKLGSPGQQVCCYKTESSTRDSRLHWDLNIVMDAWDNSCSEVANSETLPADLAEEEVVHNGKQLVFHTCEDNLQSECFGAPKQHFLPVEDAIKHGNEVLKTEGRNSVDAKGQEESCSQRGNDFYELEPPVDVASASSVNSIEEMKIVQDEHSNVCRAAVVSDDEPALSLLTGLSLALDFDEKNSSTSLKAKEAETSSHLLSGKIIMCDNTCHEVLIPGELTNYHVGNFKSSCSYPTHPEPVSTVNSVIKKHENLYSVSELGDLYPLTNDATERALESWGGSILEKQVTMNDPCGRISNLDDSDIVKVYGADQSSTEAGKDPSSASKPCHEDFVLSSEKGLTSQVPCAGEHEMPAPEMEAADGKHAVPSDVGLMPTGTGYSDHNSLHDSILSPLSKKVEVDAGLAGKNLLNDATTVLNDKFGCGHTSNASGDAPDLVNEMEKVDLLEDDDSQYEDGEFRESILHSWGDGGAEEVETEQVDYDSDNQENELLEAVSCVPSAVPIDSLACKDSLIASNDVVHAGKDVHLATSQPLMCSSISEALDTESCNRAAGNVVRNGQIDHLGYFDECGRQQINGNVSRSNAYADDTSRFTDNLANETSARIKSSGWDRLPECDRRLRVGLDSGISVKKSHDLERSGLSFRRDLSSRVERFNSDDMRRKERNYTRAIRYDNRNSAGTKSDRFTGSSGRDGPSRPRRIRGKNWFESPNHSGPRHHDSPFFGASSSFEQTGTRNAAAAAVAKVESNGFVVAPDGTLVKASGAGPASRLPKRSGNGPPQSSHCTLSDRRPSCEREHPCGMQRGLAHSRDITPERHFDMDRGRTGRYSQEMVRGGNQRPLPDDRAELAVHHLSRSERSLYPRRGPLRNSRSRTRSTSRSRTRSPRPWTPPRGSGVGINGGPAFLRRSRSPNFRSNAKMGRTTLPHQRPSFEYRMSGYGPTSRTQVSPGTSRWSDERKVSPEQLREHEYKQRSGRSADLRMMKNHRFDSIDSHGRSKPVENYRPFNSGWVAEVGGFRSSRHDEDDAGRGHGGRYGVPHGMRQYGMDSNEKPTHYDLDGDFQAHKFSPKSTGFRRSVSPRAFVKGIHSQNGDSPPGTKEKAHFRYDK